MDALIYHQTAPFARPRGAPAAHIVVVLRAVPIGYYQRNALDFTYAAPFDYLFCEAITGIRPLVVDYPEKKLRVLSGSLVKPHRFLYFDGFGLFGEYRHPSFQKLYRCRHV